MKLDVIYNEDCLEGIKRLPDNSIDLIVTDPPYGLKFMGKEWDRAIPSIEIWKEALRVLKPGVFAFIMCIPRQDCLARMIVSLEDAGFKVSFTSLYWGYASGFPKAQNIGKAVDKKIGRCLYFEQFRKELKLIKAQKGFTYNEVNKHFGFRGQMATHWFGISQPSIPTREQWEELKRWWNLDNKLDKVYQEAEREIIGFHKSGIGKAFGNGVWQSGNDDVADNLPATPQAQALDGSYAGFQPKPAVEVVIVAMKPLSEKTYVDQALQNGKGISWLDSARIPFEQSGNASSNPKLRVERGCKTYRGNQFFDSKLKGPTTEKLSVERGGRFPANLLVSEDVLNDGRMFGSNWRKQKYGKAKGSWIFSNGHKKGLIGHGPNDSGSFSRYFSLDAWFDKKLKRLPKGVQKTFPFLIVPKASKAEKNRGCEGLNIRETMRYGKRGQGNLAKQTPQNKILDRNYHPTVKPLKLMSYLITLGSREGDVILDPFIGSGTTAIAARMLGRHYIGFEINKDYYEIAKARLSQVQLQLL